jgi:maleylpyruvate isomerase
MPGTERVLFDYPRSSAAYRVRLGLGIKGLPHTLVPVHLLRGGGEQRTPGFRAMNPQGLLPVLRDGDSVLTQSLAILEYLDETYPDPPLLPRRPADRAIVRAMALAIACDIHPLNNLRVRRYLQDTLGLGEDAVEAWARHWILEGFTALEQLVKHHGPTRGFCFGGMVSLADLCLVPQMFNARRAGCALSAFPRLLAIDEHLRGLPAFAAAAPTD